MNKAAFEKADFLKYLFDAVPAPLYVVDRDLRIYHLNAAALDLSKGDREDSLLRRSGEVMDCVHAAESSGGCGRSASCADCVIRNSVSRAFQGERVFRETNRSELLQKGGTREVFFLVTANPVRYEEKKLALLILEDVTALKNAEEELKRHAARLEDANRELEAFSYSASHDLKAPLRSIRGFTSALQEDYAGRLDAEGRDYLARIHAAGARMDQLIDDMLALARATRDDLRREEVDLSALAGAVAEGLLQSHAGRGIEFVIMPGVKARCDARMMRIALENLLGNAVKFTAAHPRARIEFGVRLQEEGQVYFIRDDGAGFDMSHAGNLFSPFKRLHDASEFPGSGIGLATVRRIIHRHGGSIWAQGAVEQGAVFSFTLEQHRVRAQAAAPGDL